MRTFVFFICALCCTLCGTAQAQFGNAKKGDIIDINGVKAIVFSISPDGHGSAMCIDALRGKEKAWCSEKNLAKKVPAYNENDGMSNTNAIYEYAEANEISLSKCPAFEWCHTLGEGWYIPSVKQMETFINFILGNDQDFDWDSEDEFVMDNANLTIKEINERILDAGGTPFIFNAPTGSFYTFGIYTSTKTSDNDIYIYQMNPSKNVWSLKKVSSSSIGKYTMGRAFYDF